jgi:hypothetical protein
MARIVLSPVGRTTPNAAVHSRVELDCLSRRPPLFGRPHRPMVRTYAEARFEGAGELKPPRVQIFEHHERLHDAPGRPSSRDLVRQEAERRVADGTVSGLLLKTFGSDLSDWLRDNHPDLPQMKPRVVENVVRDIWRRAQPNT